MGHRIQSIVIRIVEKQAIEIQDVRDLNAALEDGGFVTREEAEALFRAERMAPQACLSWSEFFVDTLTAHLVWESRPTGRITRADVDWLLAAMAQPRSGTAPNVAPLLLSLVTHAVDCDERLIALLLSENRTVAHRQDAPARGSIAPGP